MSQSIAYYLSKLIEVLFRCYENGGVRLDKPPSLNQVTDAHIIKTCCYEIMRATGAANYRYNRVTEEYINVSGWTPAAIKAFEQQQLKYANLLPELRAALSRAQEAEALVATLQHKLEIVETEKPPEPYCTECGSQNLAFDYQSAHYR